MKQIFKTVAVLALAAFSASCAKEQTAAPSGGETEVTFTVSAPVIQTRADIADGNTVDKVAGCVYNSQGTLIEKGITQTVSMTNGNATFTTRLVTGQTYSFLFWAYKSKGGDGADKDESDYYTLDKANKTVTVNYAGDSNDESRDAFYKYIASKTITGAVNETVELTRPFAQINFGVEIEDIVAAKAAGITVGKSKVKLTGLANVLNLENGIAEAIEEGATVANGVTAEFNLAALPAGDLPTEVSATEEYASGILTVNNKKYGYVAMNYVLPNGNANTELTVAEGDNTINTLAVNDVPLKANYRTNILGNLFTSAVQYNIVVDPAFEDPDSELIIWDGPIAKKPAKNADGVYEIYDARELAWLAYETRQGNTFAGETIKLMNGIDLDGIEWKGIGNDRACLQSAPDFHKYDFAGTFDGNNQTISNLNVKSYYENADYATAGLFNTVQSGATIKNLTIDGATVNSTHYAGGIAGHSLGNQFSTVITISGCTVKNATVTSTPALKSDGSGYDNGDKVGGIIGQLYRGTVTGCKVEKTTITAYRDFGGIVGCANNSYSQCVVSDNTLGNDVKLIVDNTNNYQGYQVQAKYNVGFYFGREAVTNAGHIIAENNTGTAEIDWGSIPESLE